MKKLIIFCLVILNVNLFSQSIQFSTIDASQYPTIRALMRVQDSAKKMIQNLNVDNFVIKSKSITKKAKEINCPDKKNISIILTIDKSGSMNDDMDGNITTPQNSRMTIAKESATKLIDILPGYPNDPRCDIALSAFSSGAFSLSPYYSPHDILKWFTYNRDSVKKSIEKINPTGGTNYNVAFLGNKNMGVKGIMDLADQANFKPLIIFITDGEHNPQADGGTGLVNVPEILKRQNLNNAIIYPICIGNSLTDFSPLENLANATGGQVFKNIKDKTQLEDTFMYILEKALQNGSPSLCEMKWDASCDDDDWEVTYSPLNAKTTIKNENIEPELHILPNKLEITNSKIGATSEIDASIKAINQDIKIDSKPTILDNKFEAIFSNITFPYLLKKNDTLSFKIKYTSLDTSSAFSIISLISSSCSVKNVSVTGKVGIINNIENDFDNSQFLYPNPASDYIELPFISSINTQLEIYTPIGTLISQMQTYENKINVSSLGSGVYFLKYQNKLYKFIKK